jgi:hypothetical protein
VVSRREDLAAWQLRDGTARVVARAPFAELGLVGGAALGVLQMLGWAAFPRWWTLPLGGAVVGGAASADLGRGGGIIVRYV